MKIRGLGLLAVVVVLLGGLALGHGKAGTSPVSGPYPGSVPRLAPVPEFPPLFGAPLFQPGDFQSRELPPTGPQPVNLTSVGVYKNNSHSNNAGVTNVAFGDFNGDGKQDIVVVDYSTCISVFPGNGTGEFSTAPIDSCVLPNRDAVFVVPGDFDGDGILDLAVVSNNCCNPTDIYLMLAKGNGDGTFTYENTIGYSYPSQLGYSEQPTSLNAADLNRDGKLDLVMTTSGGNSNSYTSYIYLGNGNFTFTQSNIAGLGSCPNASSGVIGDFNHDGIPDLALTTGSCGLHEIDVSLGKGDGTFQPAVGYPTTGGGPSSLATGDINGDGILDFAVITGAGGSPITAFLGNGDGTFGKAINTTSVYNPDYLALGDFNGDGKADVIVSSNYSGGYAVGVQLSNGDGTFGALVQYTVLSSPTRLFVDDLNGDGHPDWVSLSNGSEFFDVALGNGDGTFLGGVTNYTTPGTFGDGTTTMIAAADFNKDGNLDYATVGPDRNYAGLNIALGDGHGNFAAPAHYAAGPNPAALTVGDFNKDGFPDIAVLDQSNDMVTVLLNSGAGTFPSGVSYQVGKGSGFIASADFNHDGKLDLIVTNSSDGTVSVLLGNGDGTFQAQQVSTAQPNGGSLTVADFNNDGKLDVAVSYYNSTTISILLGNGDGTFQAPLSTTGPDQNYGLAAGDFNKDGIVDLAVVSQTISNGSGGNGGVAILLGTGGGNFQAPVNYPTTPAGLSGSTINGLPQLGDLNNDGNLDIVVSNNNSYANGTNIGPAILLGNGDGTFTLNPAKAAVTGPNEGDVALGDFNNDGSLDVAVENIDPFNGALNLNTVTMLLSTGGTEVVLTSTPNPSIEGNPVTFTATVNTSFKNLPIPTGTMTFEYGSTNVPVTLVSAVATYETSTLPLGKTLFHAAYSGDANYNPSTSLGLNQVVKPAPLKITTTSVPDAIQNVSYSATVTATGGTPPYNFTISSGTLPTGLSINSSSGVISGTPTGLPGTSSFTVQVTDAGSPMQTAKANLSITVASNLMITTTSLPAGVVGNSYSAMLASTGGIPPYTYSVTSGALPAGLTLSTSGTISGKPTGTAGTSNFTVQAKDFAIPPQTATANLSITVTGALMITTTSLPTGVQGSAYNASVAATGGVPPYMFSISSGTLPNGLTISTGGVISGTPTAAGTSSFTVQAKDASNPNQVVTANLSITVNSSLSITTTSLPTGVVGNAYNGMVAASGGIMPYMFTVSSGTLPIGLSMSTGGVISGTPTGPVGTSNFTVKATDSGNPVDTTTANLSITVTGALRITTTSLPNGLQGSAYNAGVAATGGIAPYNFTISSGTLPNGLTISTAGVISGTPTSAGTASFTVKVTDTSNPNQVATANLSITVTSSLMITTSSLPTGVVGNAYNAGVAATGGVMPYMFTVSSGSLPAGLTMSTGGVISGTPTGPLGTSSFTVKATDSGNPVDTTTANLSITVTGPLLITTTSLPNGLEASPYNASITATGGVLPYTFTVSSGTLPIGLSLSSSGAISGTPTVPGTSSFTVKVTDASNPNQIATANLSIIILSNLMITTTSLPNGVVGNSYSATLAASGGKPPYAFTVASGTLPAGLSLARNGAITGTPTSTGTSSFTVRVKDSSNPVQTTTANLSITVNGPLVITTTSLPNGLEASPYNASIVATGGVLPYNFTVSSGTLPVGLSLSSSGAITGTPTVPGTSSFTVKVTDASNPNQIATANLSIIILSNLMITTTSLPNGVVGNSYSATLMASGGNPPYTFTVTAGTLPAGLSLSMGGVFSGTPTTTGTSSFTIQVKDSSSPAQTATANLSITVNAALMITTTSLPNGLEASPYNAMVTATGGIMPYNFTVSGGALPIGLSMSTGGVITGTPTVPGTSNFTVKVTDSSNPNQVATANFSITILSNLKITTTSLPKGVVGNSYNATLMASGGNPPYGFTLITGSLPAGLSLARSGVISGMPTTSGTSNFVVRVTDSSSPTQTAAAMLSITVNAGLTITTSSLPNAVQGSSYNTSVMASGGLPPYMFSISSGSLPAGLSISTSGIISGTPTGSGTSSFTVKVTDSSIPVQTASANLSITVQGDLKITTTVLPEGVAGNPYSATIMAHGGTSPYAFSLTSGQLPFGLSLSSRGVISGTPTQPFQVSNFTVQVTDSGNPVETATANLSITILAQLMIDVTQIPGGVVGSPYSDSIPVSGGTQPYAFSITHGALPNGLSLSSDGTVSGTPTLAGTSNFTLQVTDSSNPKLKTTANLSITISQ